MAKTNSWNNQITAANSQIILNAGTLGVAISSDASNATVSIASGAAAKVTVLGSTNGASSLSLKTGTIGATLASATGNIATYAATGEITYPLQSSFMTQLSSSQTDVTGNGATYNLGASGGMTSIYDQNSDFNATNGLYTAPRTARYFINQAMVVTGCTVATIATFSIASSNRTYQKFQQRPAGTSDFKLQFSSLIDMDAADICRPRIVVSGETGNTDDISGGSSPYVTTFSGLLAA